jgi:hypothetical protein
MDTGQVHIPDAICPEKSPHPSTPFDTHLIAGWVDPRAGLWIREKYFVSSYN